jgi:hypothetical protein
MAATGIVNSVTFFPSAAGELIVTCTFSAQRTLGSDWGAGAYYKCFATQSGITVFGDQLLLSTIRLSYTARFKFSVSAEAAIECGLFGGCSGASTVLFWDAQVLAELIKR